MRLGIIALSVVALSATAAFAGDDDIMGSRYGNTTVIHDTLGTSNVYYSKDHTFSAASWLGNVSGTWKIDNGTICLFAVTKPALYSLRYSNPECEAISAHKIGDKWTLNGRSFELVQGIQK
jgi:hypothetical protein